jgi:hypothetical protein
MIQLHEIKVGDFVRAEYDGQLWEGTVSIINNNDNLICVATSVKEFWFIPEQLYPIPLNEENLLKLHFDKEVNDDGSIKFWKDGLQLIAYTNNFAHIDLWYLNQKKQIDNVRYLHQLQNQFMEIAM